MLRKLRLEFKQRAQSEWRGQGAPRKNPTPGLPCGPRSRTSLLLDPVIIPSPSGGGLSSLHRVSRRAQPAEGHQRGCQRVLGAPAGGGSAGFSQGVGGRQGWELGGEGGPSQSAREPPRRSTPDNGASVDHCEDLTSVSLISGRGWTLNRLQRGLLFKNIFPHHRLRPHTLFCLHPPPPLFSPVTALWSVSPSSFSLFLFLFCSIPAPTQRPPPQLSARSLSVSLKMLD
ncbi:hypothetical protein HJG60_009175 [Phyllostomus discolor]|uniref:Uncharacterized protein n=1 Tax=Phyllostomus discolor TaxID=89673 RepID=A0A834DCW7_9CHIR|nr:hypothetical protein HJG60_009175 [Phyllostomus discolor]